jgi:glyoxylase-like metal-dependent hydrolase (beta-lactamase superfamily II)
MRLIPGHRTTTTFLLTSVVLTAHVASLARAQQATCSDLDVVQVRPNFYMIAGAGANIAVHVGPIGAIVVDTGSQQLSNKVIAAVKRLTDGSIRYIIDTSADADHTGGNDAFQGG